MAQTSGATALNVLASPLMFAHRQLIMDRVAALRLPAIYQWPENAAEGGFRQNRLDDLLRHAAHLHPTGLMKASK